MNRFYLLLLAFVPGAAFAQTDSTELKATLTFSGFADAYYAYDFNEPADHLRPGFLYNHNRHNEFSVNLALLRGTYLSENVRGTLALMAGTYAQYNLAAEPDMLRNIYEAYGGVRVANNLWLDAGIFSSHIGLESAISKDNLTLTRSLAAENTPYYESGAKLTYQPSEKWTFTGLVLNGWQNMREPDGNQSKAFGSQIQFKPTEKITLNSSTFFGNEKPDSASQYRYFHDLYGTFQITEKVKLAALFDIGAEEKAEGSDLNWWYNPTLIINYRLAEKLSTSARAEYYHDPNQVIIVSPVAEGFRTFGYSLNLDYAPSENALLRVEGRLLDSRSDIFENGNSFTDKNFSIGTSLAVSF